MKKNKEEKVCPICKNIEIIKVLTIDDIEYLSKEIQRFRYQDEFSCDSSDLEIIIYTDGRIVLQGEFKGIFEHEVKI